MSPRASVVVSDGECGPARVIRQVASQYKSLPRRARTNQSGAVLAAAHLHCAVDLSPIPLYTQIRELLRERILRGVYKSHTQMPSENQMVRAFGVSRITVRQALTDLQKEGLIFKIHGKGTFVSKPKATQNLRRLEGFSEAMAGAGHETFSKVLGHRVVRAGKIVGERLRLAERDEVTEIKRVRYLDREPISLDVTYVPLAIGKRLVREDLPHRDIFVILENEYGIALGNADLRIESVLADAEVAQELRIDAGSPILRIERLTFTADNAPLDFEFLYFRGDAFQYRLRIERRRRRRRSGNPLWRRRNEHDRNGDRRPGGRRRHGGSDGRGKGEGSPSEAASDAAREGRPGATQTAPAK